jgi:hypothetical protein
LKDLFVSGIDFIDFEVAVLFKVFEWSFNNLDLALTTEALCVLVFLLGIVLLLKLE